MINANQLLRHLVSNGAEGYNHKKLVDLLSGIKGNFGKKDIQLVRKTLKNEMTKMDNMLAKMEGE
jgi:hypothetical protein